MNIREINSDSTPNYAHVLTLAIPLTVVTILLPLNFAPIWRNSVRLSLRLEEAARTPLGLRVLLSLECSLACLTIFLFVTSYLLEVPSYIYPICLTLWAACVWFLSWARKSHRFWITFMSIAVVIGNWILAFLTFTGAVPSVSGENRSSAVTALSSIFVAATFTLRLWPLIATLLLRRKRKALNKKARR